MVSNLLDFRMVVNVGLETLLANMERKMKKNAQEPALRIKISNAVMVGETVFGRLKAMEISQTMKITLSMLNLVNCSKVSA